MKVFRFFIILCAFFIIIGGTSFLGVDLAKADDESDWTIYFRPGVRWGTNDRTLYILDFLVPLYQGEQNILFINPKFTPNDHDGWETNLGIGYRHLLSDEVILGLNAFYDMRKTDWGTHHRQWGLGAEVMAEIPLESFDLGLTGRFNYYYPLSDCKAGGPGGGGGFFFQQLGIYAGGGMEEPMGGLDYEAGIRIPYISDYVETWTYAGGYHYQGHHVNDVNGFMTRLEVLPTDFMRVNFEYRHDNINHSDFFGEVALEVPFSVGNLVTGKNPFEGIGDIMHGSRSLKERMVEPVRRDPDIFVIVEEGAGGAAGALPVEEVIFVSEGATPGVGDGTFENPYASIAEAMGDVLGRLGNTAFTIHVINDNGGDNVAGGGDTSGIPGLLIWGSGADHPLYPRISNMTSGYPEINEQLTIVGAGNEVMGIYFNNPGGVGLIPQGGPMLIHDNIFNSNGDHGMELQGFNNLSIYDNTFTGSGSWGLWVGGGSYVNIYDNDFNGGLGISGNAGAHHITINNNDFNVVSYPVLLEYTNADISNVAITNNRFTVTNGTGITLDTSSSGNIYDVTISGNSTVDGSSGYGIYRSGSGAWFACLDSVGNVGGTGSPVTITDNEFSVFSNSGNGEGIVIEANWDIFNTTISGNDMYVRGAGDTHSHGIYLMSYDENIGYGAAPDPVTISNNIMTVTNAGTESNSDAYGIYLNASSGLFANITDNNMSGGITGYDDAFGIYLYSSGWNIGLTTTPVTISNNPMTVTATLDEAHGIWLSSYNDIFASILNNSSMSITSTNGLARGASLDAGGVIGNSTTSTLFQNNGGTINGNSSRLMLFLNLATNNNGSSVDWTGSSFTPSGGSWSGNYPTSGTHMNSIEHNFNLSGSDSINP